MAVVRRGTHEEIDRVRDGGGQLLGEDALGLDEIIRSGKARARFEHAQIKTGAMSRELGLPSTAVLVSGPPEAEEQIDDSPTLVDELLQQDGRAECLVVRMR